MHKPDCRENKSGNAKYSFRRPNAKNLKNIFSHNELVKIDSDEGVKSVSVSFRAKKYVKSVSVNGIRLALCV